jgi:hypothetical protein
MPVTIIPTAGPASSQAGVLSLPGSETPDFSAVFGAQIASASPVVGEQIEAAAPVLANSLPTDITSQFSMPIVTQTGDAASVNKSPIESDDALVSKRDEDDRAPSELPVVDLLQSTLQAMAFLTGLPQPAAAAIPVSGLTSVIAPDVVAASPPMLPKAVAMLTGSSLLPIQRPLPFAGSPPPLGVANALTATQGHRKSHEPDVSAVQSDLTLALLPELPTPPTDIKTPLAPGRLASTGPVEQQFAALSHRDPIEQQWLETVIRDVSAIVSKTGDVRFRVEPDGFGRITIERTADRLDIGVSEARSLAVVEAARPQVLAGALALGVPVSASSVVFDQSGARHRGDAPPHKKIELGLSEEDGENAAFDTGRYA